MTIATVPFSAEVLNKVVTTDERTVEIDYPNSRIKGKPFLFYLSNLSVDARLDIEAIDPQELNTLLVEYMTVRTLVKCDNLNVLAFKMLMVFIDVECEDLAEFTLAEEFYETFIREHRDLMYRYFVFISSMVSYAKYINDIGEDVPHDFEHYEGVIDDADFVGVNIAWLFAIPCCFDLFFSAEDKRFPQFYFPVQFDDYLYSGKKLFSFFMNEGQSGLLLLAAHLRESTHGTDTAGQSDRGEAGDGEGSSSDPV